MIENEYPSQRSHPIPQILNPKFHSKKRRVDNDRYDDILVTGGSHKKLSTRI